MNQPIDHKRSNEHHAAEPGGAGRRRHLGGLGWLKSLRRALLSRFRHGWRWTRRWGRPVLILRAGAGCRMGPARDVNQDRCYADPRTGLFTVIDGKGAAVRGAQASQTVLEVVVEQLGAAWSPADVSGGRLARRLRRAVGHAHDELLTLAGQNPDRVGLRAAACVALIRGRQLVVTRVGDGAVFLLRGGELQLLAACETRAAGTAVLGPSPGSPAAGEEPLTPPATPVPLLGRPGVERELCTHRQTVRRSDRVLLTTDGLIDVVAPSELARILAVRGEPRQVAGQLLALAQQAGARDDITCIVVDVVRA